MGVCCECIANRSLADYIRQSASEKECAYCGGRWTRPRAIPLQELLVHMRERIEVEYEDAANSVPYDGREGGYQFPTMDAFDLLEAVGIETGTPDGTNEQLYDALWEEFLDTPWVHKSFLSLTEGESLRIGWDNFATLVKHRVRYLQWPPEHEADAESTAPARMLKELGDLFRTHELISVLPVGTELFRVRIHAPGNAPKNTLEDFGPPPVADARFANRMSPAGISMFYAALDENTALAETYRQSGQPAEATVATFRLTQEVAVLDLTRLPEIPSIFDGDDANLNKGAIGFLHEFTESVTKPITKDGREHIEYVPSQVVTEYVRYRLPQMIEKTVQGVRYPSARSAGGVGCVLFYAHEDIVVNGVFEPRVPSPFELIAGRTKTTRVKAPVAGGPT